MNVVRFDGPGNSEPVWDASLPQDLRVAHTDSLFPTSLGQLFTNSPKRSKACGNLSPVAAKPSRKCDGKSKQSPGASRIPCSAAPWQKGLAFSPLTSQGNAVIPP